MESTTFNIYLMKTDIAYIYALLCPIKGDVRYIGKTIHPNKRLMNHIYECKYSKLKNKRLNWIRKLIKDDLKPIFKILKICPLLEFSIYESEYINIYKSKRLTNSDETGQGNINRSKDSINRQVRKLSKPVYQYDLSGNFIKKYKSVRYAAKILSMSHSNISRSCNGIFKHTGGYIFRYSKTIVNIIQEPNAVKKSVQEIDTKKAVIKEWISIMECARDTKIDSGNLSRACNGKIKSIKGRIFKFKD